jgi:hypothetical protein
MRWVLGLLFAIVGGMAVHTPTVGAEPVLQVQPLQYQETLQKNDRKKAFIDITNPASQPVTVQLQVQGFKQIDDKGNLSFYDDKQLQEGILLDYNEVEMPARKTLRLFFVVDGAKLPTGDVFAVIFARTQPDQGAVTPSVRVGTLLMLTNRSPGMRQVSIEAFTAPLIQAGNVLTGEIKIKNTAPANSSSGFFPKITISMWPFGGVTTLTSPLVYAGNTRTIALNQPSSQLGVYRMTASYGSSHKDQWVILATGIWRWILPVAVVLIIVAVLLYKALSRYSKK